MNNRPKMHIILWLIMVVILGIALYALIEYVWFLGHYIYRIW
jgi:hypothetical protein